MKIVLDANLLISAYICDGKVREHYLHDLELVELFISPEIFIEVERNLRRGEFHLESSEIDTILRSILDRCQVIRITCRPGSNAQRESDWHVHALAVQINADCIVTGDKDLIEGVELKSVPCKRIYDFVRENEMVLYRH